MVTSLGKFLRKIRIDNGEVLKNMADKLSVSVSFLSAVENGKKRMPSEWNYLICKLYDLTDVQKDEFSLAIAETEDKVELNLAGLSYENRGLAISFARKFSDFDEEQIEAIRAILNKKVIFCANVSFERVSQIPRLRKYDIYAKNSTRQIRLYAVFI